MREIILSYIADCQQQIEEFGFGDEEFIAIKTREMNEWLKDLNSLTDEA